MLIKRRVLEAIAAGEVTLAFRRWRRPTVRAGGRLRTTVGELAIVRVERVAPDAITAEDARRAGFTSRDALLADLARRPSDNPLYRIEIALAGPDPRITLRLSTDLDDADVADLCERLDRLDRGLPATSRWTTATLRLVAECPGCPAAYLAARLGQERTLLKQRVRRLKELGLTESLTTGYRLSPRGMAYLSRLSARTETGSTSDDPCSDTSG